jgi:HlyD family secretion protein
MVRTLQPKKSRRWLRLAFAIALLALLTFLAYRIFIANRSTTQPSSASTTATESATVTETAPAMASIAAEGEIVPLRSAELSFTISGLITDLLVREGDNVEAGQPLIQLAVDDLASSVTQAEAGITQAQAGLQAAEAQLAISQAHTAVTAAQIKSAQAGITVAEAQRSSAEANVKAEAQVIILQAEATLAEAQARVLQAEANLEQAQAADTEARTTISQAKAAVEEARAAVAQTEAAHQTAKATLAKTLLRAPFAGKVASLEAEVGETISPGVPVVKLANPETWLVKTTDLTELDVVNLDVGQNVTVTVDALPGQTLAGTITHIAEVSELKRGDVIYEVTVALKNSEDLPLRWGMTAFVDFGAP